MTPGTLAIKAVRPGRNQSEANGLVAEYLRWLARIAKERHGLHMDVDAMIRADLREQAAFVAPAGARVVAKIGGIAVGVGSFRASTPGAVELRRMYVQPGARHQGAGRALLERLLDDARRLGNETVRLETLKSLQAAQELYRASGFCEIEAYRDHWAVFASASFAAAYRRAVVSMEMRLSDAGAAKRGRRDAGAAHRSA